MKKIALLASGLDETMRGYETHQRLLFNCLLSEKKHHVDLYKRSGIENSNEFPSRTPGRNNILCKALGSLSESPHYWEMIFFTVHTILKWRILKLKYDVIFYIEPEVGRAMRKLMRFIPPDTKIVYTHGIACDPQYYFWFSKHIIEVNIFNHTLALNHDKGLNEKSIHLIPHFYQPVKKEMLSEQKLKSFRDSLNIDKTKKVLLCVGVIDREIKRTDVVINQFANVSKDWILVLCGDVGDRTIIEEAERIIPDRYRQIRLDRADMPLAYLTANLLVLASNNEGFGFALIEAMAHHVPVIAPDNIRNRWILKKEECCLDFETENSVAHFINGVCTDEWLIKSGNDFYKIFLENYTWEAARDKYYHIIDTP